MRCRECGLELDARDRLPNGAYQCPECGAIYHTASSSRVSPSPYRRRRRNPFGSAVDALTERRFGLPLWAWIAAAAVVLILALILILNLTGGKGDAPGETATGAGDATAVESTVAPDAPLDGSADELGGAGDAPSVAPESTPIVVNSSSKLTGVRVNDFSVGFDWAMSKMKYTDSLTLQSSETSTSGDNVDTYTFQDWYTLQLLVVPDSQVIRSATVTTKLQEGSADNTRALAALAATMYAFDNTITPDYAREQLVRMLGNNSEYCDRTGFSANFTAITSGEYTMQINGKL